jgi:hypothetical protein
MTKQTECVLDFDDSRYPLVYVKHRGRMTMEAMEKSFFSYKRYLARGQAFAVLFDAQETQRPPGEPMKRLTDFMKVEEAAFGRYCAGIAYVLDSVLIRMVVRSIFLVQKPVFPWSVHEKVEDAERWCRERLSQADTARR